VSTGNQEQDEDEEQNEDEEQHQDEDQVGGGYPPPSWSSSM